MQTLFENTASTNPKVSLILLDWDCRESFHSLDYLAEQDVPRDSYEILWIEYYGRRAEAIDQRLAAAAANGGAAPVDRWLVMDMPADLYYHKHLMYNVGIAQARGDIVVICDSDAMFEPSFIRTIERSFASDPNIVLHIDQIRNVRRDFYPFNRPSFEDMRGMGAVNWLNGRTTGLLDTVDPLHTRNYGACMCAWRKDLVAIGGADECLDYLGHVCGPYEMTFRLVNLGRREVWLDDHYIYHSWHPGSDGDLNYVGPSDGRNMSTTALAARQQRRVMPLKENEAIRLERTGEEPHRARRLEQLIDPDYYASFTKAAVARSPRFRLFRRDPGPPKQVGETGHCDLMTDGSSVFAVPRYLAGVDLSLDTSLIDPRVRRCSTIEAAMAAVEDGVEIARRLFGDAERFEVVPWEDRWFAIPRALPLIDMADPDWQAHPAILSAEHWEALTMAANDRPQIAGADAERPARGASAAAERRVPSLMTADANAAVLAKLDEISTELEGLRRRIDRIGAIAERSQHGVVSMQHRLVHLELQMGGLVNNRLARFFRNLGLFRALRAIGLWGRVG